MSEAIDRVKNQLNDFLQGMEKKQKIRMGLIFLSVLIGCTVIIYYFTRPEYVVLYSNLDPKQAGQVMDTLQNNNIRAKFGQTSGIILVTKQDEKKAQVVVATEGLPSARFSFEDAFSANSFMMTSEERAQRFIYAKQNYLASTIEEIPGVRRAVVNLTVPERTGFISPGNESYSKASVFLELEHNSVLDSNSVNGISILVANAVQGLGKENVTIHGTDGRVLNKSSSGSEEHTGANEQINLQQAVETDLERSITDFLSTVYGYGNVVVMANVKLDFDSEVTEIKEFSPPIEGETEGIIRSMQELQKNVVNRGVGGIPGTDANTEEGAQYVEADQDGDSTYSEANRTINYEINELRRKIVKAQGQVKDITVAVYLNSAAIEGQNLTEEQREELTGIISAAAGLDTRVVQIGVHEFNRSLEEQMRSAMLPADTGRGILPWILAAGAAVLLGGAYFAFGRRKKETGKDETAVAAEPVFKQYAQELELDLTGSQVKQQIEKLVSKKPEAVAQMLKNWLSED